MKSRVSMATPVSVSISCSGFTARPADIIVPVPTSNICTMWGAVLARKAAIAATTVSA